jgi:hypothetical protein
MTVIDREEAGAKEGVMWYGSSIAAAMTQATMTDIRVQRRRFSRYAENSHRTVITTATP